MSRILIVGSLADEKWLGNLIIRVKQRAPTLIIDCFWNDFPNVEPCKAACLCDIVYNIRRHAPSFLYKIPKLRIFIKERDVALSFREFITEQLNKGIHYDIVNYHYLENGTLRCWRDIYMITNKTLLMPWGSDVLRRSEYYTKRMREYVKHYDYIGTSDNPRFKRQLIDKLSIREEQFVKLDFGSESIDRLMENENISRLMAKETLGVKDRYVITIGYNANEEQNHLKIIDAISKIEEKLPKNYLLVFPMTYGRKQQVNIVKQKLEQLGLEYLIFDNYLSYQEIVNLRKSSDMFIHAQTTDSNSASLAEYLFCGSVVINAAWLQYEHYEQFGVPYYTFDSFPKLPGTIEEALNGGAKVNNKLIEFLKTYSWAYKIPEWLNVFEG